MKRVREASSLTSWPVRLQASWAGTPLPLDMWRHVVAELADDLAAVRALGRVNLALYAAFGGFEHLLDFAFAHGHEEAVDRARRVVVNGETLLHPLKWASWTDGNYDDSTSLFQQLAGEMDRAEPTLRAALVSVNFAELPAPLIIAGGFVRALMLRLLRRVGVATPAQLSELYGDIDVWLEDRIGWDPYRPLLPASDNWVERSSHGYAIRTFSNSTWSDKSTVQYILASSIKTEANRSYAECVIYYFDFTACQAGTVIRAWDRGEVMLTPAFLYSLLTGHMYIGPRNLPFVWPLRREVIPLFRDINKAKTRLLMRFRKYLRLGYKDILVSAFQAARMTRLLRMEPFDAAQQDDRTDYIFLGDDM